MVRDPANIYNRREDLIGQLAYVECKLLTNLQPWERKEWVLAKKDLTLQIYGLNCAIEFLENN